jgi:hypothetical protein
MSFNQETINDVWKKGSVVPGVDECEWRKDQCGAWINYGRYGDRKSEYGWEIDHITPESKGGNSNISNLRPLNWRNNVGKSDGKLVPVVTAKGNKNILLG